MTALRRWTLRPFTSLSLLFLVVTAVLNVWTTPCEGATSPLADPTSKTAHVEEEEEEGENDEVEVVLYEEVEAGVKGEPKVAFEAQLIFDGDIIDQELADKIFSALAAGLSGEIKRGGEGDEEEDEDEEKFNIQNIDMKEMLQKLMATRERRKENQKTNAKSPFAQRTQQLQQEDAELQPQQQQKPAQQQQKRVQNPFAPIEQPSTAPTTVANKPRLKTYSAILSSKFDKHEGKTVVQPDEQDYEEALALLGGAHVSGVLEGTRSIAVGSSPRDPARALALLEKAANAGNDEAMFVLGFIYEMGTLGVVDDDLALHYYNQSAIRGNPKAQYAMGFRFETGKGVPVNHPLAVLNYEFASQADIPEARITLGYKHLHGHGVQQDCEKAMFHYRRVAQQVAQEITDTGLAQAVELIRLSNEDELAHEEEDVVQYWKYSADSGDIAAMVMMGTLYLQGAYGVPRDYQKALHYFQTAASHGDINAVANLGFMYLKGYGVTQNNQTARSFLVRAARKNNPQAQAHLGQLYLLSSPDDPLHNEEEAIRLFRSSAEQGHPEGLLHMGNCHFYGKGVKQDYGLALQYYSAASHAGSLVAQFNLAQMHRLGLSVARSCHTAVLLYKRVVERGRMGQLVDEAHDRYEQGDISGALLRYEKAACMGLELAQSNAAWLYYNGLASAGVLPPLPASSSLPSSTVEAEITERPSEEQDEAKEQEVNDRAKQMAFDYYKKAAEQKSPGAYLKMGDFHYYGNGRFLQADRSKAAQFYQAASDMRNPQAAFNLGYMHQHGLGLPQDFHLAKRYYDLALTYNPTEAYVPSTLALLALKWHQWWQTGTWGFPDQNVAASPSSSSSATSATAAAGDVDGSSQGRHHHQQHGDSFGGGEDEDLLDLEYDYLHDYFEDEEEEDDLMGYAWDTVLLVFLASLLAALVIVRQQAQMQIAAQLQMQAPPRPAGAAQ
ncbi:Protein sel-1 1 [Balamuthia mandrillaris]